MRHNQQAALAGFTQLWSEDGQRVVRQLSHRELVACIGAQQVMSHFRNGRKIGVRLIFQPRQSASYSRQVCIPSSSSLTHQDSSTNALAAWHPKARKLGLNQHELADEMIIGNDVDRVMSKIEMWPSVGDNKAARVGISV